MCGVRQADSNPPPGIMRATPRATLANFGLRDFAFRPLWPTDPHSARHGFMARTMARDGPSATVLTARATARAGSVPELTSGRPPAALSREG
jgi:hypothetical protein